MNHQPTRRATIAVHASYRGHNYGDVLLVHLCTRCIKEFDPSMQVALPLATDAMSRTIGADGSGLKHLARSAALVYAGGGYFGEPPTGQISWGYRNLLTHIPVGVLARLQDKPIALLGVGVGPISNPLLRSSVVRLCEHAQVVAVRNEESYEYLVDYGVSPSRIHVTADPALALTRQDIPAASLRAAQAILEQLPHPWRIGVHLHVPPQYKAERDMLVNEVVQYARQNPDVGVLWLKDKPAANDDDLLALCDRLPQQSLAVPYPGPWVLTALLGSLRLVLTTKLHVGIVSSALGTRSLAFPYHDKVPRFYRQIGAAGQCVPLSDLAPAQVSHQLNKYRGRSGSFRVPAVIEQQACQNRLLLHGFLTSVLGREGVPPQ